MDFTLEHDVACGCGYNLRGLRSDGRCPECGRAVAAGRAADADEQLRLTRSAHAKQFTDLVRTSGYPLDAFLLVTAVIRSYRPPAGLFGAPAKPKHVTAAELARHFRDHCGRYFNDEAEARDLLTEWRLSTSEDLGRVVFALIAAGRLTARPEDRPADFDGLFTLDTLFD